MRKFLGIGCLCFLAVCVFPARAIYCWVNVKDDFSTNQPLVLQANSNEFLYPVKSSSNNLKLSFCETIRAACPQGNLTVFSSTLNRSEGDFKCYGLSFFHLVSTRYTAPFKRVSCTVPPSASANLTAASCPNGQIAQIGFQLQGSSYVPTIDQICYNSEVGQSHWAHSKVILAVRKRQSEQQAKEYQTGDFYQMIQMSQAIYTRDSQRARLLALLEDQATVDALIPANSDNYLVEGMLVPRSDMFYRAQQDSTFFYINTVPMWKSVRDGNWKLVEEIVRKTAGSGKKAANLDVWTGGYQVWNTSNSNGDEVDITLTTTMSTSVNSTGAVPVPRYLFKYVVDQARNSGVVFVTINDPKLKAISADDIICSPRTQCSNQYPQFNVIPQGFTYCCAIDMNSDFFTIADELGLPTFLNAQPLI